MALSTIISALFVYLVLLLAYTTNLKITILLNEVFISL